MLTIVGQPTVVKSTYSVVDEMFWRLDMVSVCEWGNGRARWIVVVDVGVGLWQTCLGRRRDAIHMGA